MNISHRPIFNTNVIIKHYTKKDGVDISYVCTSALGDETSAMDIFYRETPHPKFSNRYFGLYHDGGHIMICSADGVEDLVFDTVLVNGQYHYSQHRHDFHTVGPVSIDGGRAYTRLVGDIHAERALFVVRDGRFVRKNDSAAPKESVINCEGKDG